MIFHGKNRTIPPNIKRIYLNGVEVKRVDTFKYIGLILDSKLTFAPHINSVCNKLNKFFGIFSHIKNIVFLAKMVQYLKRFQQSTFLMIRFILIKRFRTIQIENLRFSSIKFKFKFIDNFKL